MSAHEAEKGLSKTRLEALSDGVFAIAMTLLVLDIRLPETLPGGELHISTIKALGPAFFGFFLTFMLSGTFWYLHHVTIHNLKYVTRDIAMINVVFLMFVSLLPFSTGLLPRLGPGKGEAQLFYFANQLALSVMLNVIWWFARRRHLLITPIADPRVRFMIRVQPWCYTPALVTACVYPEVSYWVFLFGMLIGRRIATRKYPALPANAPAPL